MREGIAKHRTSFDHPSVRRFEPDLLPPLEAQICGVADEIVYAHHDLDDALNFELIRDDDLKEIPWVHEIWQQALAELQAQRYDQHIRYRVLGILFDRAVLDVLRQTTLNIEQLDIQTLEDVRRAAEPAATFSPETARRYTELRDFLWRRVYRHHRVVRNATRAERFVCELFDLYVRVPEHMPLKFQERCQTESLRRVVCDYIAGMTDRFCQEQYSNAFESQPIR